MKRVEWMNLLLLPCVAASLLFAPAARAAPGDCPFPGWAPPMLCGPMYVWNSIGNPVTAAKPGEVVKIQAESIGAGQSHACDYLITGPYTGKRKSLIVIKSVTGGSIDIPENDRYGCLGDTAFRATPITMALGDTYAASFTIRVKAGALDKKGKAKPIVITWTYDMQDPDGGFPHLNGTIKTTVPVEGAPDLAVAATPVTAKPGETEPGLYVNYQFTADAAGEQMTGLSYKATIPKGTTLKPGTIFPSFGTVAGSQVTWIVTSQTTHFVCGFNVAVNSVPGTTAARVKFGAAATVLSLKRNKTGQNVLPIRPLVTGQISYVGDTSLNGEVTVGKDYSFSTSGWDTVGGDLDVTLDGKHVTTVAANGSGVFHVTPFPDSGLDHGLSARQTGKPATVDVHGTPDGTVELIAGTVRIVNDDGSTARTLGNGDDVALGEVDPTNFLTAAHPGPLTIDGDDGVLVLRYLPVSDRPSPDSRLIWAFGGDVRALGAIEVGTIKIARGKGFVSKKYKLSEDLTSYDTNNKNNTKHMFPTCECTAPSTGYLHCETNFTPVGDLTLTGGLLYVDGDSTIEGDLIGTVGSFLIDTGNITLHKLHFANGGGIALGCPKTLTFLR